jgi:hypothetical protein
MRAPAFSAALLALTLPFLALAADDAPGDRASWRDIYLGQPADDAAEILDGMTPRGGDAPERIRDDTIVRHDVLIGGGMIVPQLLPDTPITGTVDLAVKDDRIAGIFISANLPLSSSDGLTRMQEMDWHWSWLMDSLAMRYGPPLRVTTEIGNYHLDPWVGRAIWRLPGGAMAQAGVRYPGLDDARYHFEIIPWLGDAMP